MPEETKPVEREAFDPTLTLRAIQRVEHALHVKIGNADFAAVERILVEEVVTPTKRASADAALERAAALCPEQVRARVATKPRKALFTAEEGYDAAIVDYSDRIRALKGSR
jgi:hypothetical protein